MSDRDTADTHEMDDGRIEVRLRIKPDSLEELLRQGEFVSRVWLTDRGDGVYSLQATPASGDPTREALIRLAYGRKPDDAPGEWPPETPGPSPEAAETMRRMRERWEWDE